MMSASLTIGAVLAVLMIIYLSEGLMTIMPRGIVGTAVSGTALRYPCVVPQRWHVSVEHRLTIPRSSMYFVFTI